MHVVYGLVDPRDRKPFYIGITDDVYRRFCEHISGNGLNPRLNERIQELRSLNLMVIMETYQEISTAVEAHEREAYWIHHYLRLGVALLNSVIPTPLYAKTVKAQIHTLKAMRDAEIASLALSVSKDEAVRELRQQGWGKIAIIEKIWQVKRGGTEKYQQAEYEYSQIMAMIEESEE